jgi:hypothetical protein
MPGGFTSVKIHKISGRGWRSTTGAKTMGETWEQHEKVNSGYISLAIATVDQKVSEMSTILEKLRLGLDVVRLRDS